MTTPATPDPRERDPRHAQPSDPQSGTSDDPRVDPTPDRRQTDDANAPEPKRNAHGVVDPTADVPGENAPS